MKTNFPEEEENPLCMEWKQFLKKVKKECMEV